MNAASNERDQFRQRLCYSIVAETMQQIDHALIEARAVRILCQHPAMPGKRLRPLIFLLCNLSERLHLPVHLKWVSGNPTGICH